MLRAAVVATGDATEYEPTKQGRANRELRSLLHEPVDTDIQTHRLDRILDRALHLLPHVLNRVLRLSLEVLRSALRLLTHLLGAALDLILQSLDLVCRFRALLVYLLTDLI